MKTFKTLIVCKSIHHKNTFKLAQTIATVLDAEIKSPTEVNSAMILSYDLIGFGSGIYNGKHHAGLNKLIESLELTSEKPAFVFTSSTVPTKYFNKEIIEKLTTKNFKVIDDYICKGFMSYSFTKYIFGGLNKNHPDEKDLAQVKKFAEDLKDKL